MVAIIFFAAIRDVGMTGCSYWLTKFTKKAVLAALALVAPAGPWLFCVRSLGFISLSLSRTAVNTDHYLTTVSEFSKKLTDHWVYDKKCKVWI